MGERTAETGGSGGSGGPSLRVGHGYDLHRLAPVGGPEGGKPLVIGGIRFEHDCGPVAHSDGDALFHAITDAILGALGLPDIGRLFPDTDPRWAGADSAVFLREAGRRLTEGGWSIANLDATVVLERPKLGARKDEIRSSIARALAIDESRVNVKGKTHEGVDAIGLGRAIEAHAVVLLVREALI
jgi:2-C-methyl-D-erythritol 2,4-cyclodiphosphate synthase